MSEQVWSDSHSDYVSKRRKESRGDKLAGVLAFIIFVLLIATPVGGFISFVIAMGNHSTHVSCLRLHEQTGLPTRTVGWPLPDCFIKVGDEWIPPKNYIVNKPEVN